jgi:L-aspartate oxidase
LSHHYAIDLILDQKIDPFIKIGPGRCLGAYVFDKKAEKVRTLSARWTILATGGAGKVYLYTSNWEGATGDGIAMAHRAGARVTHLEFMQFHPTCLYHPSAGNFLISESLRGEGGELITRHGDAFMKKYHPMGSLAPRDIVARSIDAEMKISGDECVFLDMTHLDPKFIKNRFPAIFERCQKLGIDISIQPIPVVPAAHYLCGGVITNVNGQSDIDRLLVIGESACTGFHGANRLASNSLLECIAMGINAAKLSKTTIESDNTLPLEPPDWVYHSSSDADELIVITHMWDEIRRLMWNYVGIVRSHRRLLRAKHRLGNIRREIRNYYWNFKINTDLLELRNIALIADLTVKCALSRKESRGIHYNLDFPEATGEDKKLPL